MLLLLGVINIATHNQSSNHHHQTGFFMHRPGCRSLAGTIAREDGTSHAAAAAVAVRVLKGEESRESGGIPRLPSLPRATMPTSRTGLHTSPYFPTRSAGVRSQRPACCLCFGLDYCRWHSSPVVVAGEGGTAAADRGRRRSLTGNGTGGRARRPVVLRSCQYPTWPRAPPSGGKRVLPAANCLALPPLHPLRRRNGIGKFSRSGPLIPR